MFLKPLISIILPTYNSAKTLEKTIQSVMCQSYLDWELIVVDDCSTDNTSEILSGLASKDSKIKFFRLDKNGGCYVARNEALKKASSEYVAFIDADDLYEPNYLQKLTETANRFNADVVWCNHKEQFIDAEGAVCKEITHDHKLKSNELLESKELLLKYFRMDSGSGALWNKIYKKEFLDSHKIIFDEKRRRSGDWVFNIEVFRKKPKVVAIEDCLYSYIRSNANSVVASFHEEDFENYKRSLGLLKNLNREFDLNTDMQGVYTDFLYNVISHLYRLVRSANTQKKKIINRIVEDSVLRNVLNANSYNVGELTLRYKVYLFLIRYKLTLLLYLFLKI